MTTSPRPQPAPVPWTQSTGMVGGITAAVLGGIHVGAATLMTFGDEVPRGVVIAAAVVLAVVGFVGMQLGLTQVRKRKAKGAAPASPQPPIGRVQVDGLPSVVMLLAAGALAAPVAVGSTGCGMLSSTQVTGIVQAVPALARLVAAGFRVADAPESYIAAADRAAEFGEDLTVMVEPYFRDWAEAPDAPDLARSPLAMAAARTPKTTFEVPCDALVVLCQDPELREGYEVADACVAPEGLELLDRCRAGRPTALDVPAESWVPVGQAGHRRE
jgi:hypothetical protein